MTFFAPDPWMQITAAARTAQAASDVAVAYFSNEGPSLLPLRSGSLLIADASIETVSGGSTSPAALRTMLRRGVRIFSAQNLHAKVFAFDTAAFVGSANASKKSSKYLIEAVWRVDDPIEIASIRDFVRSLAITELDDSDLSALQSVYRPPRPQRFPPRQAKFTTLIMELTLEQGGTRVTQVQPPLAVWEHYFGIDIKAARLPRLTLIHKGPQPVAAATGAISKHDHNLTVEIPGAELPRPALLELRKTGTHTYLYEVHRAGPIFNRYTQLLASRANPLWRPGRKWLII